MAKIFLNTLDQFYYEKMIASSDFTEMVNMGMRLDEAVREGRLVKESAPINYVKQLGKRKEREASMMAQGTPRQGYPVYQHVAAVMPNTNIVQNPGYQPQFQQYQQQYQRQPRQHAPRTQFEPIPMKYADLLPILIEKNLVWTKAPLPVPAKLPSGYRVDLSCAFHQGAPGHDVERCFALKKVVHKLIRANRLSFEGSNPNV